ncbi:MAG: hypothetical protein A3B96_00670 [Candidatus Spechtbacteria bacterium RIFCSPHIGHO2_02_FULL_43_15b]|nr:MAG: hypothetical protein A3B96_00670 [Candidatus Spechtbacteria bacterium RIFCSPHIGHO2_02_FULL_43_15b]
MEINDKPDIENAKGNAIQYLVCVSMACNGISSAEIIAALEKALVFCPERRRDIVRIAKGLPNLCERTAGKAYILELEAGLVEKGN